MLDKTTIGIAEWIVAEGLRGASEVELLDALCEKLVEAGVPLLRANVAEETLHPLIFGYAAIWERGKKTVLETWERTVEDAGMEYYRSPFGDMIEHGLEKIRHRIFAESAPTEYPLVERLKDEGATDYLALRSNYSTHHRSGDQSWVLSSWTADAEHGFGDENVKAIETLVPVLGLNYSAVGRNRILEGLMHTYLGRDAGNRVLKDSITRGTVETIRAVLWYSDLTGSTRASEELSGEELLDFLNDYFECVVDSIHEWGGEVLKFVGDSVIAIFPLEEGSDICSLAISASDAAMRRIARLNKERESKNQRTTDITLALHTGEVMYGNIGSRDRLDFTVVGQAVNEVSRMEEMCRSLEQKVVVSAAFFELAERCADRFVSLGRYALRGVSDPRELFTIVPQPPSGF